MTPVEVFLNKTREKIRTQLEIEMKEEKIREVVKKLAGVECDHVNIDYHSGKVWCWKRLPFEDDLAEDIIRYITREKARNVEVALYVSTKELEHEIDTRATSMVDVERAKQVFGENVNVVYYFDDDLERWVIEIQVPLEPRVYDDIYQYLIFYI